MAYLKFSIPSFRRGEVVQHQSRTFYRNWLKMFTNHRPPRRERPELYWHSRLPRVLVSGVWWSLCIIGHCHQDSLFPITMLFLMLSLDSLPRVSWLPACAARCSPDWRWPPLGHLGSSQDSKPNSSYENFTEITSTHVEMASDNIIWMYLYLNYDPLLFLYYYQSITWIWIIPLQPFRNPHWSHDVAATLEHGEIFLKMKGNWNPRSSFKIIFRRTSKSFKAFLSSSDVGCVMM